MQGKLTNLALVIVMIAGFTLFVAGLERGGPVTTSADAVQVEAEVGADAVTEEGLIWRTAPEVAQQATEPGLTWRAAAGAAPSQSASVPIRVMFLNSKKRRSGGPSAKTKSAIG